VIILKSFRDFLRRSSSCPSTVFSECRVVLSGNIGVQKRDMEREPVSGPFSAVRKSSVSNAIQKRHEISCTADWRKKSSCETVTRSAVRGHTIDPLRSRTQSRLATDARQSQKEAVLIWKKPLGLKTRNQPRNDPSNSSNPPSGFVSLSHSCRWIYMWKG
jgi:hypothetical protein